MKTLVGVVCLILALSSFAQAQGSNSSLLTAVARLPACAQKCLGTAILETKCDLTDVNCICLDSTLQSTVDACVTATCSIRNALVTKNQTVTLCNAPIRDRSTTLRVSNITLGTLSAVCVLIRLVHKAVFSVAEVGWDDYLILATLIAGIPSTVISDRGTIANGMGRDIWTLQFDTIIAFIRWFYILEILYFNVLALLKLSLLFFFLRIFPGKNIRRVIWGTIAFDVVYGLTFVIVAIFQCRPLSYYWTRFDGEHTGECVNMNAVAWANAAISIALDFWMLALPLSQVFSLKMKWKKKLSVALMFCVGTFVTVVSILRLQSLVHFAKSTNPTQDQADVSNWSDIEINIGIICACMPALRVVLAHAFPSLMGTSRGGPSNQYYENSKGRSGNLSGIDGRGRSFGGGAPGPGSYASKRNRSRDLNGDLNGITYTKSFEVSHAVSRGDDEEQLVQMDNLSSKGRKVGSSGSSECSVSGVINTLPQYSPSTK